MPSRVSLSALAFICGLSVMFVGAAYDVVAIPVASTSTTTLVAVFIGLLAMTVGWMRIFTRRPRRFDDNSNAS